MRTSAIGGRSLPVQGLAAEFMPSLVLACPSMIALLRAGRIMTVSYTHLTLPTILRV